MKHNYFISTGAALTLAALVMPLTLDAQSVLPKHLTGAAADAAAATAKLTQRTDIWGDWYGASPSTPTPTQQRHYFYDNHNRLILSELGMNLAGDSETTVEIEKEGDQIPREYIAYSYDERGNMVKAVKRTYGIYDGRYQSWKPGETVIEQNAYDEENRLIYHNTQGSGTSGYTWDGKNLVEENDTSGYGNWKNTIVYTDFLAGHDNCPQTVLDNGRYSQQQGKYEYDAQGRPVKYTLTKIVSAKTDEANHMSEIVLADNPTSVTTWTYGEQGTSTMIKKTWSTRGDSLANDLKTEVTLREDGGLESASYRWNTTRNAWGKSGSNTVDYTADYTEGSAPTEFTATTDETKPGRVVLTAKAPADAKADDIWKVYRNGVSQGRATLSDGQITFTQDDVKNEQWVYFIQRAGAADTTGTNATDLVTLTMSSPLPAPADFHFVSLTQEGKGDNATCKATLAWKAPTVAEGVTLLGYNVYSDIKSYNTNPSPDNGTELITDTTYTTTWDVSLDKAHTVYVEAVYNLGRTKSAPLATKVGETPDRLLTTRSQMGNSMGTDELANLITTYYYDTDNRLSREMEKKLLSGDNPQTPDIIEKAGDYQVTGYRQYFYNTAGKLKEVRYAQYLINQGANFSWTAPKVEETYTYAADSTTLIGKADASRRYEYTWDGANLTQEKQYSIGTGNLLYTMTYSDFVEGKANLPQKALKYGSSASNQRIIETTYNEAGQKLTVKTYKLDEITTDAEGNVTAATKGTPEYDEAWTYDAEGRMTGYLKQKWNDSKQAWINSAKTDYTYTADGETEQPYSWTTGVDKWTRGRAFVNAYKDYYKGMTPTGFTITPVEGKVNTVTITADVPSDKWGSPVYSVYRNGMKVGDAKLSVRGDALTFTDEEVPNGDWDYFIYTDMQLANVATNITVPVTKTYATELPAVTKVWATNAGLADGNFSLDIAWDAPETDLKIVGYNVYSDIKSYTKNPVPDNGANFLTETAYSFTPWSAEGGPKREVYVETVYNIGRIRSAMFPMDVNEITGIGETVAATDGMTLNGRTLNLTTAARSLTVYDVAGIVSLQQTNVSSADLSRLPQGVYVVKAITADGHQLTAKISLR